MQNKLPADPSAMILGIIGLVIGLAGCCCYGITAIIPLALSIWGFIAAKNSLKLYNANPTEFTESSRSNVSMGKILNIISIILNGFVLLSVIAGLIFFGIAGMQGAFDDFTNDAYGSGNEWEYDQEYEDDFNAEDDFEVEEIDSLSTDSIFLEEVYPASDSVN